MFPLSQNITTNSTETLDANEWCRGLKEGPITWVFLTTVNFLFGFPACVAVIWEQFKRHRNSNPFTPNDVFMLNITVMDLVYFVFFLPDAINYLLEYSLTFKSLFFSLATMCLAGRPLLMACVCVDCYLAVVHPLVYRARKSLAPRVVAASIVWLAAVAHGILIFFKMYEKLNAIVFFWPHVISLPTIAFCDFSILWALKRSDPGGRDLNPQKKRAHQIIVNSLIMTAMVYLPTVTLSPLMHLLPLSEDVCHCQVCFPLSIVPFVGSTVSPIVYLKNLGKLDHLKVQMKTWLMGNG